MKINLGFYRNNKTLIFIVLFAILIRMVFFLSLKPWDAQIVQDKVLVSDAEGYHKQALDILKDRDFSAFGTYRVPVFPAFVAGLYFIFGIKPWIVLLMQIFLNVIAGLLIYRIAKELFDRKTANITAFLFFIEPSTILHSSEFLTDTLFVTLFVASILFLILGFKKNKIIYFLASAFVLGITTLSKPLTQFLPYIILIVIFSYTKLRLKQKFAYSLGFFVIFLLTLSPWLYRNYRNYGYAQLSSCEGDILLNWNVTLTEAIKTGQPLTEESFTVIRERFKKQLERDGQGRLSNPFYLSGLQKKLAWEYIKNNTKDFAKCHIEGILNMYRSSEAGGIARALGFGYIELPPQYQRRSIFKKIIACFQIKPANEIIILAITHTYLLIVYFAFLYGGYLMMKEKECFGLLLILLILLYFSIPPGIIGQSRYKLSLIPFYLLLSGKGLKEIICYCRRKHV